MQSEVERRQRGLFDPPEAAEPLERLQIQPVLSPEAVFRNVFRDLRPRTPFPPIQVEFCRFANANAFIQLKQGEIQVRITDVLSRAPGEIWEALAYILLSKLYRRPVPREYSHRYRRYLSKEDVREQITGVRQARGRKELSPPQGEFYNLQEIFDSVNARYFHGLMAPPSALGWSKRVSRQTLGHYDPSHHTIVLSRILDSPRVPKLAVEYVMYHEMLHIRFPTEHKGARRCMHGPEFKKEEKKFEGFEQAKAMLKSL